MKIKKKLESFERLLGRIFLFLIVFSTLFLLAEFFSRYLIGENKIRVHLDFKNMPRPYVMYGNKLPYAQINSLGYLGELPQLKKNPKEIRVFFMGGSTLVYGHPPLPDLIQQKFIAAGFGQVKIFNFGVTSSNVEQDLVRVLMDVSHFSPDFIVMYGGGNELLHPDPRPGYPHGQLLIENNPLWKRDVSEYPLFPLLAFGSHLLRYLFAKEFADVFLHEGQLREKFGFRNPTWQSEVEDLYLWSLGQSLNLSKNYGAKFLAVFQPMSYFKKYLTPTEQSFTQDISYYQRMRDDIWNKYKKLGNNFELLNYNNIFNEEKGDIFYDSIHVLDRGNEILAQKLFIDLRNRLQLSRP